MSGDRGIKEVTKKVERGEEKSRNRKTKGWEGGEEWNAKGSSLQQQILKVYDSPPLFTKDCLFLYHNSRWDIATHLFCKLFHYQSNWNDKFRDCYSRILALFFLCFSFWETVRERYRKKATYNMNIFVPGHNVLLWLEFNLLWQRGQNFCLEK